MSLAATLPSILAACISHAQSLGLADLVLLHEPKSKPGKGVAIAFWSGPMRPVPERSGLASTTIRLEMNARVSLSMLADPQDTIDQRVLTVADGLIDAYSGDFTLGGLIANVDLLGAHGDPLAAELGYFTQDNTAFRAAVLTVPLIVDDLWSQAP